VQNHKPFERPLRMAQGHWQPASWTPCGPPSRLVSDLGPVRDFTVRCQEGARHRGPSPEVRALTGAAALAACRSRTASRAPSLWCLRPPHADLVHHQSEAQPPNGPL